MQHRECSSYWQPSVWATPHCCLKFPSTGSKCVLKDSWKHWHLTSSISKARDLDASNHSLNQGLLTNCSGNELVMDTWALLLLPQCQAQNPGLFQEPWPSDTPACCEGLELEVLAWLAELASELTVPSWQDKVWLPLLTVPVEVSSFPSVEASKGQLAWPSTTGHLCGDKPRHSCQSLWSLSLQLRDSLMLLSHPSHQL